jgi:hypothetical protein
MGKVSENKFVGQPILRQIVNILPREKFDELVIRLGSDKYYKAFFFLGSIDRDALWHFFPLRLDG